MASAGSKVTARGKRFGGDQNSDPDEVFASSGNVYVSCAILLWKRVCRAQQPLQPHADSRHLYATEGGAAAGLL